MPSGKNITLKFAGWHLQKPDRDAISSNSRLYQQKSPSTHGNSPGSHRNPIRDPELPLNCSRHPVHSMWMAHRNGLHWWRQALFHIHEAIAKTILADMNNEKPSQSTSFPYSRYKNTNDITWRAMMSAALDKARRTKSEECEQLSLGLF